MKKIGILLLTTVLLSALPSTETRAIVHPNPGETLAAKWAWMKNQTAGAEGYYVAYTIPLSLQTNQLFLRNATFHFTNNSLTTTGISLEDIVAGKRRPTTLVIPNKGDHVRELRRVAIVQHFPKGARRASEAFVCETNLPLRLKERRLFWLGEADPVESVSLLREAYQHAEKPQNWIKAVGVHQLPQALDFLEEVLRGGPTEVRVEAVEALYFQTDKRAVSLLIDRAQKDAEGVVRAEAAETLGDLGTAQAEQVLIGMLRDDPAAEVRAEVAESLARFSSETAWQALIKAVWEDPAEHVRAEALESLPNHKDLAAELNRVIEQHPSRRLRRDAVELLPEKLGDAALNRLRRLFDHQDLQLAGQAVESLAALPEDTAVPVLRELIKSERPLPVRREAIAQLRAFPSDENLELLVEMVQSHQEDLREEALDTLRDWPNGRGRDKLIRLLSEIGDN